VPAAPWAGSDQSHFTEQVHDRTNRTRRSGTPPRSPSPSRSGGRDDANRIIAISEPLARTVGWDRGDIVGRRVVALIPPALREAHVAGFSRHLTTGQAHVLGVQLTLPVLRKDGSEVPAPSSWSGLRRSAAPVYLAWIEPIAP
jgi:PAS domain S-box-containing protein